MSDYETDIPYRSLADMEASGVYAAGLVAVGGTWVRPSMVAAVHPGAFADEAGWLQMADGSRVDTTFSAKRLLALFAFVAKHEVLR